MLRLRRAKKTLLHLYGLYLRKKKRLFPAELTEVQTQLRDLEKAILDRDGERAEELEKEARKVTSLKKSVFEQARDLVLAVCFALFFALLIRQLWFELYEIPTGSMRPTFKEQDRLIVSKTRFGINAPFSPKHLLFDPSLVERSGVVVFTVENMDVRDADTLYFYLFPGKKQFVKRLIGKPGDTLYFYGGKIYGIDREGKDISKQLQLDSLASIDHIPFIRFEGTVKTSEPYRSLQGEAFRNAILYQMNEPIALLSTVSDYRTQGEMLNLRLIRSSSLPPIKEYGDLWGMKNYAKARLFTAQEIKNTLKKLDWTGSEGLLYLELCHSPSLHAIKLARDQWGRLRPCLELSRSYIPLGEEQLKRLFRNLYTARFVVKNGFATRYARGEKASNTHFLPKMKGVPDGTYELYNGIGYQIKWSGVAVKLPQTHPLMQFSVENLQLLFNLGIHFDIRAGADTGVDGPGTERFAYFRDGDLHVMGTPLLEKGQPLLTSFLEQEEEKKRTATVKNPYTPFVDPEAPSLQTIADYGLLIPENRYLVLGDNFAMSSDSRDFGFVPEGNLRGAPSFIFWPPGFRFGPPNQPAGPWFTAPHLLMGLIVAILLFSWWLYHRRKYKSPLKF